MARQRIVVLKIGGEILRSQKLFENAMREIIRIKQRDPGTNLILVHGAGPQIDQQFQAANVAIKKKEGRRVTTEAGMDVIWNFIPAESKRVAQRLWSAGIRAESIDSSITTLARIRERNLGFVGTPIGVNLRQLHRVLRKGAIPIVSICGLTKQGQIVNVNADEVAANIAVAVRASRLELKTNVPGVMKDGRTDRQRDCH
jgi:acetylglutamate kinase